MSALGTENAFKLGADITRCVERGVSVVRFNLGEPDFETAPHIADAAIAALRAGRTRYCDPAGLPELRHAIATHVSRTRGLDVAADRVVVTPGGKPSIGYTLQTYVDPGDEVIYPSPAFPIYESWITYIGARPIPLQLHECDDFLVTADSLERAITPRTKLIILNSPANPTGAVLPLSRLSELAAVIQRRCASSVRVYSDEIYEHIVFEDAVHHSIASVPGMETRTIIASGHSKGFAMTGWRLGYAVLPTADEASHFKQLNINVVSCVPPFVQEAGRAALEKPESAAAVARMVRSFRDRRDWVVPVLNRIAGVRCRTPQGAFYVFPEVGELCASLGILDAYAALPSESQARTSPSTMLQRYLLEQYGVATMDRPSFGRIGSEGQHFLRLSIATGPAALKDGLERIEAASRARSACAGFFAAAAGR